MAGGPGSIEIRSSGTRAITEGRSNTGWGTMVEPVMRQARMPALSPNEWKNGLTMR